MRLSQLSLLCLLLSAVSFGQVSLPNAKSTPGAVRTVSVHELCTTSTKLVRHTTAAMKKSVCRAYGITTGCPGPDYEIDHLIPLEIGGADEVANLWPQPIAEAHVKDRLENRLHKDVCAGKMQMSEAQQCLAADWRACWEKHGRP